MQPEDLADSLWSDGREVRGGLATLILSMSNLHSCRFAHAESSALRWYGTKARHRYLAAWELPRVTGRLAHGDALREIDLGAEGFTGRNANSTPARESTSGRGHGAPDSQSEIAPANSAAPNPLKLPPLYVGLPFLIWAHSFARKKPWRRDTKHFRLASATMRGARPTIKCSKRRSLSPRGGALMAERRSDKADTYQGH